MMQTCDPSASFEASYRTLSCSQVVLSDNAEDISLHVLEELCNAPHPFKTPGSTSSSGTMHILSSCLFNLERSLSCGSLIKVVTQLSKTSASMTIFNCQPEGEVRCEALTMHDLRLACEHLSISPSGISLWHHRNQLGAFTRPFPQSSHPVALVRLQSGESASLGISWVA